MVVCGVPDLGEDEGRKGVEGEESANACEDERREKPGRRETDGIDCRVEKHYGVPSLRPWSLRCGGRGGGYANASRRMEVYE
jgi:hypothetical protein